MLAFEQIDLTIAGLRAHYQRGDFTARELIALLRARSKTFEDRNIWIHELSDVEIEPYLAALDKRTLADAPLYGVPFAIKDNIDLALIPTTAACAAIAFTPEQDAFVVSNLIAAGAIPLGKTNLDQLATGINGTRSPWGACRNSFNPEYISGGSSSGSAVAVALGLASFSLGTDTAGSGRIPAAFNNIVGWKPSRGLLSSRGMLPACRTLDCITLFASTASDINSLVPFAVRYDENDAYSRRNPAYNSSNNGAVANAFGTPIKHSFEFGVPRADQLEFYGDENYRAAFAKSVELLESIGGKKREIDFSDFLSAARLLYEGPWIAERYHGIQELIESKPWLLLPVIQTIIGAGRDKSAVDAFDAMYKMQEFRRRIENLVCSSEKGGELEFIATPTAGTHFTIEQMLAEPILRNSELGYYTNFMNLLDLAAVAVPTQILDNGMPFGITLFSDRFTDLRLLSYAQLIQATTQLPVGAVKKSAEFPTLPPRAELSTSKVVVCGAHMSGLPFNNQLLARNAKLVAKTKTASSYRFYALPIDKQTGGGAVQRPGLIRVDSDGAAIEVEVWEMPSTEFGSFVAAIPQPLGIGKVELENGEWLPGFICEGYAVNGAEDITALGGWRAFIGRNK